MSVARKRALTHAAVCRTPWCHPVEISVARMRALPHHYFQNQFNIREIELVLSLLKNRLSRRFFCGPPILYRGQCWKFVTVTIFLPIDELFPAIFHNKEYFFWRRLSRKRPYGPTLKTSWNKISQKAKPMRSIIPLKTQHSGQIKIFNTRKVFSGRLLTK